MLEFFIYSEIELKFNFSSLESEKGKKKYYLVIETRHVSERTATENKMSKKGAVRGGGVATESEDEGGILGRRVCLLREKIGGFINLSRRGRERVGFTWFNKN